jgi:hypothetical protein
MDSPKSGIEALAIVQIPLDPSNSRVPTFGFLGRVAAETANGETPLEEAPGHRAALLSCGSRHQNLSIGIGLS